MISLKRITIIFVVMVGMFFSIWGIVSYVCGRDVASESNAVFNSVHRILCEEDIDNRSNVIAVRAFIDAPLDGFPNISSCERLEQVRLGLFFEEVNGRMKHANSELRFFIESNQIHVDNRKLKESLAGVNHVLIGIETKQIRLSDDSAVMPTSIPQECVEDDEALFFLCNTLFAIAYVGGTQGTMKYKLFAWACVYDLSSRNSHVATAYLLWLFEVYGNDGGNSLFFKEVLSHHLKTNNLWKGFKFSPSATLRINKILNNNGLSQGGK